MTDTRRKRQDGVRTLDDIRDRCRIDEETGCWIWSGAVRQQHRHDTPVVHVPAGVAGFEKRVICQTARVALLLTGAKLGPGKVAFRACRNPMCVRPDPKHVIALTRLRMAALMREDGAWKTEMRRRQLLRTVIANALPAWKVREIEEHLDRGGKRSDIAAAYRVSKRTVQRIADRQHMHSGGKVCALGGASVFTLGSAA